MKKEDEAFKTLYTIDVIDKKGDPWRVLAAYRNRSEAEAAVCRAIMVGIYHGVQMSKWNKKWVSG